MVLSVNIQSAGDDLVKDVGGSLNLLLCFLDSLLGTLDLDLGTSGWAGFIAGTWNINLCASLETESIEFTSTSTDEGRKLRLCDRDGGFVGVVHDVLQQTEQLVTGLVSTSAWTSDNNLVGVLVGTASGLLLGDRNIIVSSTTRARELDPDVVSVLQTVDAASLCADEVPVVLRLDLEDVRLFVFQLLAHGKNVRFACIRLGLGTLDLNLAIVDLNVNVVLVTQLPDILTLAADELVGKLLGEVEGDGVATLELVLLLLLNEGEEVLDKVVGTISRTTDGKAGCSRLASGLTTRTTKKNLKRNLTGGEAGLLAIDVSSDLVVELDGSLDLTRNNVLLSADQSEKVLLCVLQSGLELLDL